MININKFKITERPECSADTKLFFDDVYKSGTRRKKAQVETVQYGRSMIEMLGVLAIVGVLSVGGIAGYSKAMEKFKINKTLEYAAQIINNIQVLYAQQSTFSGLNTETAIQMGVIPGDLGSIAGYNNGSGGVSNPLKGLFIIENWSYTSIGTDHKFSLFIGDITKSACIQLATTTWGSADTGLRGINIGSGHLSWYDHENIYNNCTSEGETQRGYYMCSNKLPFPVAKASQYCNCDNNDCFVHLHYGK